ncbi:MAG: hypothetical protein K1X28_10695 [Parachlamydiales bacterium]|nr:hypothetical protein [Parachlamydiales bacterium]
MTPTLTQSIGYQTKQYLETARDEESLLATHVAGRVRLLATALVGTVEIVARLAFFMLGHVAGIFSLYRSPEINDFLREQIYGGFTASVITSASLFSILSPSLFESIQFPQEEDKEIPEAVMQRRIARALDPEERRVARLVADAVSLPFQMVAFCFKVPFYLTYLTFQAAFVLPIRIMMLPFQLFISALTFDRPKDQFRMNLI